MHILRKLKKTYKIAYNLKIYKLTYLNLLFNYKKHTDVAEINEVCDTFTFRMLICKKYNALGGSTYP